AVGASPGPRAVVLHRAVPAGFRTRRCRNGVAHGERERESQSNLAQHDQSPHMEARSGFYGLDRRAPRLFPGPHSNGVRSAQVFVRCLLVCLPRAMLLLELAALQNVSISLTAL